MSIDHHDAHGGDVDVGPCMSCILTNYSTLSKQHIGTSIVVNIELQTIVLLGSVTGYVEQQSRLQFTTMSAADPSGPSQPTQQTAYNVAGNAASKEPAEQGTASQKNDQSVASVIVSGKSTTHTNKSPATNESPPSKYQATKQSQHH